MANSEDELLKVKRVLKQWEHDFFQENQRRPVKDDIDVAPENIASAYRRYSNLKRSRQQPAEVWGKELNKSTAQAVAKNVESRDGMSKKSVMSSIGKKLLLKASFGADDDRRNTEMLREKKIDDDDDTLQTIRSSGKSSIFETAIKLASSGSAKPPMQTVGASTSFVKTTSFMNGLSRQPVESVDERTTSPSNQPVNTGASSRAPSSASSFSLEKNKSFSSSASNTNNESTVERVSFVPTPAKSFARDISDSEAEDDYASFRGKKQSKKKTADQQESKRALAVSPSGSEDEDNSKSKAKGTAKPRKKRAKKDDDAVLKDNYCKLNMKAKRYQPKGGRGGGGRMTFRQRMMEKRKNRGGDKCYKCGSDGHWARDCTSVTKMSSFGALDNAEDPQQKMTGTCFRCGEDGHWARQCRGGFGGKPSDWAPGPSRVEGMPNMSELDDVDIDESDFPSMEEAVMMSRGIKTDLAPSQLQAGEERSDFDTDLSLGIVRSPYIKPAPVSCFEPLYQLNEDGSLPETPQEVFDALLEFGFTSFRPGQEQAVMRVCCGLSTLVVLSTGAGKSLCYQLAAYLYGRRGKCITLVVSPLVSLMQDQVAELPYGIRGACIHTNMTLNQRRSNIEKAVAGELHFLLMSPEMIVGSSSFVCGVSSGLLSRLPPIAFTCIDEAHCVSEWSHHFRPSYLRVCMVLREHYGVKCMLGLTATATTTTAMSVAGHLGINSNHSLNGTIRGAPVPENLMLSVSRDGNRDQALIHLLKGDLFSKCKSVIVYCTRREQTTRVAHLIRTSMRLTDDGDSDDNGDRTPPRNAKGRRRFSKRWNAECYHAGLTPAARKKIQEDFMSGRVHIVVATVAFGMGINKSDITGIIHYTMPKNIESYVQEIGRAGRNGKTAYCHLFLDCKGEDRNELKRHIYGRSVDRISVKKLVRRVFAPCKCSTQSINETTQELVNVVEGFDVSGLDTPWEDCDEGVPQEQESVKRRVTACPSHERALPIGELVHLLDMKEEVLETLLVYLELHPKKWIENQQPVLSRCTITFYGGKSLMLAVAKKCPPVAVAIAQVKQRFGSLESLSNKLEFNVVELSDMLGWESGPVRKELKLLSWESGQDGGQRSSVMVDFDTLAYHFRSPGDMSDEELDEVVDFLMGRIETQEKTELYHLENFHETLESVSYKNVKLCCNVADSERSEKLRSQLHRYLECDPPKASVSALSFTREVDAMAAKDSDIPIEIEPEKEEAIRRDVQSFVQLHGEDHKLSGRAIARIMHGIDSPRFPATSWGRNKRFWRSHLDVEFHTVRRVATRELVRCR